MITSKQRSALKAIAQNLKVTMQIGKEGVSEASLTQLGELLFHKEIVKINVLKNCEYTAKELINDLAEKLNAEPVIAVGNKIVLYKYSSKENIEHIVF